MKNQKRKKRKLRCRLTSECAFVFHKKRREICGKILQRSRSTTARKCSKMGRIVVLLIKPILFLTPLPVAVFIALEESVPRRTGLILS